MARQTAGLDGDRRLASMGDSGYVRSMNQPPVFVLAGALSTVVFAGVGCSGGSPGATSQPAATSPSSPTVSDGRPTFHGLPLSATSAATVAAVAESREHVDLESVTRAYEVAVRATDTEPGSILAWLQRADASLSPTEINEATTRAVELSATANAVEKQLLEIRLARNAGDTDRALAAARKLVDLAPKSAEAHFTLSRVLTLRGQDTDARTAALDGLRLQPDSLSGHALLGESYTFREPRDLQKAAHHFKKTVELRPAIAAAYVSLGDVYRAGLDLEAAAIEYGRAIEADASYPVSPIKRGHVNSFLGHYRQARADYDAGIALGTTRMASSLSSYRAFVSIHEGKPEAALVELTQLSQKIANVSLPEGERLELAADALRNRAIVALHLAERDQPAPGALAVAESTVQEYGQMLQLVGAAAGDQSGRRKAEATAAYWRSRLHLAAGDLARALEQAEAHRAAVQSETSPRKLDLYHELRGLIALHKKEHGTAVDHLRKSDLQTDVFAKYHLAVALSASGRGDEARRLYREVADWSFNSPYYALLRRSAGERATLE